MREQIAVIVGASWCALTSGPELAAQARPDVWPDAGSHVYVGSIDGGRRRYPIQMTLELPASGAGAVSGQYRYERSGLNLTLAGELTAAGRLTLTESDGDGRISGTFAGRVLESAFRIHGRWRRAAASSPDLPFDLRLVAVAGTTEMRAPGDFGLALSVPRFLRRSPLAVRVNREIRELAGDTQTGFDVEWLEVAADEQDRLRRGDEESWRVVHMVDRRLGVYHAGERLISIGDVLWMDTGGAHGNYGYSGRTWVQRGDAVVEIELEDLLANGSKAGPKLVALVAGKLRAQGADWPGDLDLETLDSFVLSPAGVVFAFDPYCVGPYAAGPFHAPVKWSEAEGVLVPPPELGG